MTRGVAAASLCYAAVGASALVAGTGGERTAGGLVLVYAAVRPLCSAVATHLQGGRGAVVAGAPVSAARG